MAENNQRKRRRESWQDEQKMHLTRQRLMAAIGETEPLKLDDMPPPER